MLVARRHRRRHPEEGDKRVAGFDTACRDG